MFLKTISEFLNTYSPAGEQTIVNGNIEVTILKRGLVARIQSGTTRVIFKRLIQEEGDGAAGEREIKALNAVNTLDSSMVGKMYGYTQTREPGYEGLENVSYVFLEDIGDSVATGQEFIALVPTVAKSLSELHKQVSHGDLHIDNIGSNGILFDFGHAELHPTDKKIPIDQPGLPLTPERGHSYYDHTWTPARRDLFQFAVSIFFSGFLHEPTSELLDGTGIDSKELINEIKKWPTDITFSINPDFQEEAQEAIQLSSEGQRTALQNALGEDPDYTLDKFATDWEAATKDLFKIVKKPEDMIKMGEQKLKSYIKTIGLYNSKAKNIINLSKILIENYKNKIPSDFKSLTNLPGVGNKTASVFQNEILNIPRIAVDTHVFRVSNRIGLVATKNPDETQEKLERITPKKWLKTAHHLLILHGRYTCKSQNPLCGQCAIFKFCNYKNKNEKN